VAKSNSVKLVMVLPGGRLRSEEGRPVGCRWWGWARLRPGVGAEARGEGWLWQQQGGVGRGRALEGRRRQRSGESEVGGSSR